MMDKLIKQAMARGCCTKRNEKKVLDSDLIEDMAKEVIDALTKQQGGK